MKLKHLLVSLLASAVAFTSCQDEEKDFGLPEVKITTSALSFNQDLASSTLTVTSTRDWMVSTAADWVAIYPSKGKANTETVVTITVLENETYNRTAAVKFDIGYDYKTLTISQEGPMGEKTNGSGTISDPYTVRGVLDYIQTLGTDESPDVVYIQGKIASISETYSAQYGNASFTIKDEGIEDVGVFTAYRVLYLGNKKWTASDDQISIDDEVIVAGRVYNYGGKTPETVSGTGYLYSHNGKTAGGGGSDTPVGEDTVFYNNFDLQTATQSGTQWPALNEFQGWLNQKGTGIEKLVYAYNSVTVRSNSVSSGNYSDYAGSGSNNLFFGEGGYIAAGKIAVPSGKKDFTLSFGSERYLYGASDNTFVHSEFHVYVSDRNATKWVELQYAFPNGDKSGRWDLASSTFTVPDGTDTLAICVKVDLASAYRLDDLRLDLSSASGVAVDFNAGVDLGISFGGSTPTPDPTPGEKIQFTKVNTVTSGKAYILVAEGKMAKALASNKTYGYLYVDDVTDNNGVIELSSDDNIFIFEEDPAAGWTIKQKDGRYLYMSGTYNSFNIAAAPNSGQYWTVESIASEGTFKITNTEMNKYIQYSSQYTSYGSYDSENGSLPALYEMSGDPTTTPDPTPDPDPVEGESITLTLAATSFTAETDATYGAGFKNTIEGYTVGYYKYKSTSALVNTHTDHIRVYKNAVIVIDAPTGTTMKSLTFNCTYADKTFEMTVLEGGGSTTANTSAKTVSWTGSATRFVGHTVNGQCQFKSIDVIFE